jgi:biotin carboxyl carrier protein
VPEAKREGRRPDTRAADHAEIGHLTETLLPALIAKLGSTRLGELEVRGGEWRVRLRRPASADGLNYGRRATDKPSRAQPGHEGHAHPRGAPESLSRTRLTGVGPGEATGPGANGSGSSGGRQGGGSRPADRDRHVAYSPAVGVFHPGTRAAAGTRVKDGETLGTVDVLGVPQDVIAPADGIVATTLVEGGTAVEYGQELVQLELTGHAEARA